MIDQFTLTQPEWMASELERFSAPLLTDAEQMREVIRFSRLNIERNTGGPFAAGVFDEAGNLVAMGVNRVLAHQCSSAHAEIMALSLAQRNLGHYDLGVDDRQHQLVVNWRPCAMCFGALIWSGVRRLVIAGSGPELETITGFDEGQVTPEWREALAERGISLADSILMQEAVAVFEQFRDSGGLVYNSRGQNAF